MARNCTLCGLTAVVAVIFSVFLRVTTVTSAAAAAHPSATAGDGEGLLHVDVTSNGSFSVFMGEKLWLTSAPMRVYAQHKWYSTVAGGGLRATKTRATSGSDELGAYTGVNVSWSIVGVPQVRLFTSILSYRARNVVLFVQELPDGLNGTQAYKPVLPSGSNLDGGAYPPIVSFPAFSASEGGVAGRPVRGDSSSGSDTGGDTDGRNGSGCGSGSDGDGGGGLLSQLGYVLWEGCMVNIRYGTNAPMNLQGLTSSGPVVLFDGDFTSLVVSPLDNFKEAVHTRRESKALLQMYGEARHDHALCITGSQCYQANQGSYTVGWVEAMAPTQSEIEAGARELGMGVDEATVSLYDYYSDTRQDNLVTTASKPPADKGYCDLPDSCFKQGVVFSARVNNSVPLTQYFCSATNDSVTVASARGLAYVHANNCVSMGVIGWAMPALSPNMSASDIAWETGVNSELESLPRGFVHRTLMQADARGVTAAMDSWGQAVRAVHKTQRRHNASLVTNALSYWTDNGAYYYGDAWGQAGGGGDPCNETSMVDVAGGLKAQGLLNATQIWQLDDWWYPGQHAVYVHCVHNWTLGHPAFTSSLAELSRKIDTPWLLYVPFICRDSVYADSYRFVNGSSGSTSFAEPHPDDALRFYSDLFDYGVQQGMRGYENDFLNFNLLAVPYFRQQYGASFKWLQAINDAALARDIDVQFCMALPSDLMASVRFNSVTNYRASGDYAGGGNYNIGGSALLAYALDLRPSKDNFWTHRPQSAIDSGKPWNDHSNPGSNCELNTIIATLSTGPVGIADKAGDTNATLIWRSVRSDGTVLQPDRPASVIDAMFTQGSLGTTRPAPPGLVWATSVDILAAAAAGSAVSRWHYVISIDVKQSWALDVADMYPAPTSMRVVSRRWHNGNVPSACTQGTDAMASGCISGTDAPILHNDRPIMVANDTHLYDLHMLAPVADNGWVLLGDTSKYVSVSRQRFAKIDFGGNGIECVVVGAPNEHVDIVALKPKPRRHNLSPSSHGHAAAGTTGTAISEWTVVTQTAVLGAQGQSTIVKFS